MAHDKPQSFLDALGADVEMTSDKMDNDLWAQNMLKEIGKVITGKQVADGMKYVGSFAIHIIRTEQAVGNLKGQWDMASITQIAIDEDCSEQLATLAFNNAVIQLRRYFNPDVKSGRRGDKR